MGFGVGVANNEGNSQTNLGGAGGGGSIETLSDVELEELDYNEQVRELGEEIAISGAKYYASKNDYSSAIFVLRGAESAEARSLKEEYERKYYRLELYQPDISYPDTSKLINDWHGITEPSDSPGITKPTEDR